MKRLLLLLLGVIFLNVGCIPQGKPPWSELQLSPDSLANRQLQTRIYTTENEKAVLTAVSAVLQDFEFNLDEYSTELGVIVASKKQLAAGSNYSLASLLLAYPKFFASIFDRTPNTEDATQLVKVLVVVHPLRKEETALKIAVRATFQQIVFDQLGNINSQQLIKDPEIYTEFFEILSKSLFLEANQI